MSDTPNRNDEWKQYLSTVATQLTLQVSVVAVGANTENSIFNGCYEDLAILNGATTLPVIYNDFVTSVFQLLQAKIHGAHAVKLLACVLEVKDLNYLIKVAKSLGLCAIIVVASKPQLLSVLSEVIGWQAVSVSSRNMRLWKVYI